MFGQYGKDEAARWAKYQAALQAFQEQALPPLNRRVVVEDGLYIDESVMTTLGEQCDAVANDWLYYQRNS